MDKSIAIAGAATSAAAMAAMATAAVVTAVPPVQAALPMAVPAFAAGAVVARQLLEGKRDRLKFEARNERQLNQPQLQQVEWEDFAEASLDELIDYADQDSLAQWDRLFNSRH